MNHILTYKNHFGLGDQSVVLCEICGRIATDIHHIKFKSHGGKDNIENLIALCRNCHEKAHSYKIDGLQKTHDVKLEIFKKFITNNLGN